MRRRVAGAGRLGENRELKETPYECCLVTGKTIGGRVGMNFLRARTIAARMPNKKDFAGYFADEGGSRKMALDHLLRRFRRVYGLAICGEKYPAARSSQEIRRRLGAYWVIAIRVRAHFFPRAIRFDA